MLGWLYHCAGVGCCLAERVKSLCGIEWCIGRASFWVSGSGMWSIDRLFF